jgi:uncharacterized integral membrane protein
MLFIAIQPQIDELNNTDRLKEKFLCSFLWPLGAVLLLFTVLGMMFYLNYTKNKSNSINLDKSL